LAEVESLSDGGLMDGYSSLCAGSQPPLDSAESEDLQDNYRGGGNDSHLGFVATRMTNEAGVIKKP